MKYRVTKQAKRLAKEALAERERLPKSKQFGTRVGLVRARQIIRSDYLTEETAKRVCRFKRFIKCTTPKCEGALKLWGGRGFIRKMCREVKK